MGNERENVPATLAHVDPDGAAGDFVIAFGAGLVQLSINAQPWRRDGQLHVVNFEIPGWTGRKCKLAFRSWVETRELTRRFLDGDVVDNRLLRRRILEKPKADNI